MKYTNDCEIRIFTMSRSGHSAIATWIAYMFGKPTYYFNNVRPFKDPLRHSSTVRNSNKSVRHTEIMSEHKCFVLYAKGGQERYFRRIKKIRKAHKKCLMYAYEDFDIRRLWQKNIVKRGWVGQSKKIFDVIIIRDIFNLVASRRKCKHKLWKSPFIFDRWSYMAEEALGKSNYTNNTLIIDYNKWFSDIEYRKMLALKLNIEFSDAGLNFVPGYKRGSSFSGLKWDRNAQKMKVLHRWKSCMGCNRYKQIISGNQRVMELAKRMYPEIYESFKKQL